MNCYIIRIYRQEVDNPRELVGIVEEVGAEGKRAFTNLDELWKILNTGRKSIKKGARSADDRKKISGDSVSAGSETEASAPTF